MFTFLCIRNVCYEGKKKFDPVYVESETSETTHYWDTFNANKSKIVQGIFNKIILVQYCFVNRDAF